MIFLNSKQEARQRPQTHPSGISGSVSSIVIWHGQFSSGRTGEFFALTPMNAQSLNFSKSQLATPHVQKNCGPDFWEFFARGPRQGAIEQLRTWTGSISGKVSSTFIFNSQISSGLTFENFYIDAHELPLVEMLKSQLNNWICCAKRLQSWLFEMLTSALIYCTMSLHHWYGVASVSRLLKIIGLFCKRAL